MCAAYAQLLHKLLSQKFRDGFRAGSHAKFFINPADVGMDGLVTDLELVGDFLIHQSLA